MYTTRHEADSTYSQGRARASRYKLLAQLLVIPARECHIGMFDVETCERVIALCDAGALAPDRSADPRASSRTPQ